MISLYQAPPLYPTADGFRPLARATCQVLRILGAAEGVFFGGGAQKWIFVARRDAPQSRGWVSLRLDGTGGRKIGWSSVPIVPSDALAPAGSADIAFVGGLEPLHKAGDRCSTPGLTITQQWWVTIRNRGTAAGPIRLYKQSGAAARLLPVNLKVVNDVHLVGVDAFRRSMFPGESLTFVYENDVTLVLDPNGKNYTLDVPGGEKYTCGQ